VKYTVVFHEDVDGGFVTIVPALQGCVTQGDSIEDAMSNAKGAAELYIESCLAHGDPIPSLG